MIKDNGILAIMGNFASIPNSVICGVVLYIPDWKLGFGKYRKKAIYFFFVEVKRSGESSKYQKEADYVKLLKEMKNSIDKQISMGLVTLLACLSKVYSTCYT